MMVNLTIDQIISELITMSAATISEPFTDEQSVKIKKHLNFIVANHWIAKMKDEKKDIEHYEDIIRKIFNHFKESNQIGPILDPFRWYSQEVIDLIRNIDKECFVFPNPGSHVIMLSLLSWDDCDPVFD